MWLHESSRGPAQPPNHSRALRLAAQLRIPAHVNRTLLHDLKRLGWDPVLHVIILGTLGEIPRQVAEILKEIGVKDIIRDTLQKDLHENAITWMDKCIDTEIALNLNSSNQNGFARHKRRKKDT